MTKRYNLYMPGEYSFKGHFLPLIEKAELDAFEADTHRWGIQRKDNNHLCVFLEHSLKMGPSHFTQGEETGRFAIQAPKDKALFERILGDRKEVSVFALFYTPRMTPLAWKVMIELADDPKILVMDDARNFMPGPDCALELKGLMV
ncbi:MAG TPA: hypothetical protein VHE12_07740 [bacterium]|nr:hypothetical protein [bacterium]